MRESINVPVGPSLELATPTCRLIISPLLPIYFAFLYQMPPPHLCGSSFCSFFFALKFLIPFELIERFTGTAFSAEIKYGLRDKDYKFKYRDGTSQCLVFQEVLSSYESHPFCSTHRCFFTSSIVTRFSGSLLSIAITSSDTSQLSLSFSDQNLILL